MKRKILAALAALGLALGLGCATMLEVTEDVCETSLGGSKVGDALCDKIGVLKSDEAEEAE